MQVTKKMLKMARTLGKSKGETWADVQYLLDGGRDTARDAKGRARAMLAEYDSYCPEWAIPPDWLSGEWADEPTPKSIAEAVGYTADDEGIDEISDEIHPCGQ